MKLSALYSITEPSFIPSRATLTYLKSKLRAWFTVPSVLSVAMIPVHPGPRKGISASAS